MTWPWCAGGPPAPYRRRMTAAGGTMRMRYHFGSHTLDVDTVELRSDGEAVVLEPRTFAVLSYLVRNRDRVVPKEELLDEIWGDRFVGEAALTSQIKHARAAVGDDGRSQRVIRTAHRIGYRFVADVVEEPGGAAAEEPAPAGEPPAGHPPAGHPPAGRPAIGQRPVGPAATWLPSPGKALFGRDNDVAELAGRLTGHRLVTITGPGGVGKTAVAGRLLDERAALAPDGAWMCDLATTRDPASIANVVLGALGEGQQSDADPGESLLRFLERRRALVVLDNCEHVLGAAADLARGLLGSCPELRVVATSRVPLGLDGESVHALEPLGLSDAVSCFAARAGDAGAVVDRDDPALAELCRRLDCVPLALELAAARARLLSPGEMLALLADRFKLLRDPGHGEAGEADDGRHRSLRRTIAWSWDGLSREDQRLLARLGVFVGAFTLEDARRVAMDGSDPFDAVDALGRLVGGSLVAVVPAPSGRTRFRLLESIRDFAADHLDDPDAVRARHATYYAALAEKLDADLQTERIDEALAAMQAAWDNLRAAVGYAADVGDVGTVRRIVRAVGAYADVFQVYEVLDWCAHADAEAAVAVAADGDDLAVAADALAVQARMLAHRGEQERAGRLAALAHDRHESHATLLSVVWCAYYGGDLDLVMRCADRLHELSRSDRGFDRGFAEGFSAMVVAVRQEADIASTAVSPADAERGILGALDCLSAGLRLCTLDPGRAAELLEAVVDSSIRHDYRLLLGAAASTLTQITLPGRPAADAMRTLRRTLTLYLERSMWVLISADTVMAARLLADQGDVGTACRLLGARAASGYAVGLSEVLRAMLQDELERALGRERFDELAAQGACWRPPEAAEVAIAALDRALGEPTGR